ncbi:MAG: Sec7 domain-containing protein [Silvanigrellaceae bacterium]
MGSLHIGSSLLWTGRLPFIPGNDGFHQTNKAGIIIGQGLCQESQQTVAGFFVFTGLRLEAFQSRHSDLLITAFHKQTSPLDNTNIGQLLEGQKNFNVALMKRLVEQHVFSVQTLEKQLEVIFRRKHFLGQLHRP